MSNKGSDETADAQTQFEFLLLTILQYMLKEETVFGLKEKKTDKVNVRHFVISQDFRT